MTKNKDLKRAVRTRMAKTGESYTAARAQVLKPEPKPEDFAQLAGMADERVKDKTGKTWSEWVRVLDKHGAVGLSHRDIARFLKEELEVDAWWAQSVTVGYERIRGLREVGQRRGGTFDANKSKTFGVPVRDLYRAFRDSRMRKKWLTDLELEVTSAQPDKSIRAKLEDGSRIAFYFEAKGDDKSRVAIQHSGLPTKKAKEHAKAQWAERLAQVAQHLS